MGERDRRARFEELRRHGRLGEALAAAREAAAHEDDEERSCTLAGEHGEASRAGWRADEWRARARELECRIGGAKRGEVACDTTLTGDGTEMSGIGGAKRGEVACPGCGVRGTLRAANRTTRVKCPRCGAVWDTEAVSARPDQAHAAAAARFVVPRGESRVFGRHPEHADAVLGDMLMGRRHFRVSVSPDGAARIEDLASAGGTFVNDEKARGELARGDRIRAGGTTLVVEAGEDGGVVLVIA